jgi:hypothetical protein
MTDRHGRPSVRVAQEETRREEHAAPNGVERRLAQIHQAGVVGVPGLRDGHVNDVKRCSLIRGPDSQSVCVGGVM